MATALNHIIRKAVVDFQFNGNTDGIALRNEVKDWFDEFSGRLEQVLNGVSGNGEVISINELRLEIGLFGTDWKQQASHKLLEQLNDRLRLIKTGIVSSSGYVVKQPGQHFAEVFLYFLQHGNLPWQSSVSTSYPWIGSMEELMNNADSDFVVQLINMLSRSATAKERFIKNIPFQSAITLFTKSNILSLKQQRIAKDFQLVLDNISGNKNSGANQPLFSIFLQAITHGFNENQLQQALIQLEQTNLPASKDAVKVLRGLSSMKDILNGEKDELMKGPYKNLKEIKQPAPGPIPEEGIYLSNAGLVIIAAMIPALFQKTGLVDNDNNIRDIDRAVCFINYLATGKEQMEEFELALPKILSGVDIDTVIDTKGFSIDDTLEKESTEMLSAVIEHWSILKNTSIAGLRESFLIRNGKLSFDGNDWLLQAEPQSYDMLLQHLPWNFTMIKFSWMKQLLKTEWI